MKPPIGDVRETLGFQFRGLLRRQVGGEWCDRIEVTILRREAWPDYAIRVRLFTPDARGGRETNDHYIANHVPVARHEAEVMTKDDWIRRVIFAIQNTWMHELSEALQLNGEPIRDPHKDDRP